MKDCYFFVVDTTEEKKKTLFIGILSESKCCNYCFNIAFR